MIKDNNVMNSSHNNRYATQLISSEGGNQEKNKACGELYQL
ncbi:unnamed protein product [marine sediment metagenome]|uniref:Uncharacterized protein n=1 Tax=marine sediment metagenome TaxID=412755 RepID=X1EV90_9ZZZZ